MKSAYVNAAALRRGYLLPIGIVLVGANLRAPITSLGPVLDRIQSDLSLGDSAAGLLGALPLLVFALLSLVAPAIARAIGLERGIGAALVAILVGTVVRSCPFDGAVWLGMLLLSAGIAIGNVLLPGLVKREFPERSAFYTSLYAAAMASAAGLSAGLAVPVASLPGSSWRVAIGMSIIITVAAFATWLPQLRFEHRPSVRKESAAGSVSPWRHPIGWQISGFFACHSFVFYSLVTWYASIGLERGESAASTGFDLLLYQVVAVVTSLLSAPLIKRMKDQRAMGYVCGASLLVGALGLWSGAPVSAAWLVVAGLGAGFSMTTSLSLFALRTHHHDQAARLSSMAQFIGYSGSAVGPLLMGALHAATGAWRVPLAVLIVVSALVAVFAVLAGRRRFID
ncbi:MFS transporter [Burkholderia gladioli]|uniref:MFS transporter n=1 Tax=Burkholderia gladioli TaxID=28095 RepID=UPI0016412BE6|nr:MFS transporter [Burkholderia gladioli]